MALPQALDPDLLRRVELAAVRNDTSIDKWIERAVRHELDREEGGIPEDEDNQVIEPPAGVKPRGSKNPVRLRGGATLSDAVIEDRR